MRAEIVRRGAAAAAPLVVIAALLAAPPLAAAPGAAPPPNAAPASGAAAVQGETAVALEVRLDRDRAAVGEPITMTVTARHAGPLDWERRSVSDKAGVFDVDQVFGPAPPPPDPNAAKPGAPGDANASGPRVTQWVFRLAAFEVGKTEIPPISLRYTPAGGGEPIAVLTPARKVEIVATVTNPEEKPADIRSGFGLPRDLRGWILLFAAVAAAAIAAILLRRWWRRRRARPAAAAARPPAPRRPAYDRYLEALEALLRAGHLESGRIKEFHVEIAEIAKRYLGEVLGFDAIDRTTWEAMQDLQAVAAPQAVRSEAGALLNACDLVKFAKHLPDRSEIDLSVARARRILDLARPAPAASARGGAP